MNKNLQYYNALEEETFRLWSGSIHDVSDALRTTDVSSLHTTGPMTDTIVAEGDSWFNYGWGWLRVGRDILHQLKSKFNHEIAAVAEAGDTLENMVYGTEVDKRFRAEPSPWWATKRKLEKYNPKVFLFSGGGNDFSGPELAKKLNHQLSGRTPIRSGVIDYIFDNAVPQAFQDLCKNLWAISPETHIILHGYGVPSPDGTGVVRVFKTWAGPWLRPYLASKGIADPTKAQEVIRTLVNRFNETLAGVAATNPRIHYLDLRSLIRQKDWDNELHLNDDAYERVADLFHDKIQEIHRST